MQDDNIPHGADTPTQPNEATKASAASHKKMIIVVGAVLGVLLLVLISLVAVLISKSGSQESSNTSSQVEEGKDTGSTQASSNREVLLRVPTSDPKLEYVIYKPQQNGANTTVYFAIENICSGCSEKTYSGSVVNFYDDDKRSFLVDDTNGKKYSLITDEDGKELASPTCGKSIAYGEKESCFASFTKVPSGSTVSWVFGNVRIDKIKVD